MNKKALRALCLLLMLCLPLSGCVSLSGVSAPQTTLPPVRYGSTAPDNDVNQTYEQTVALYLPARDGTQLLAVPQTATLSAAHSEARELCEMLLSHPGTESAAPLGGDVALALSDTDPVEVSGAVATVSLAASALRLSHERLFVVGQALANTLAQFGEISAVNVLIAGAQPGLNIASTLPAGCYTPNLWEDLGTLWARASAPAPAGRRSFVAALYFPGPSGKGVLCEARTLSFQSQELPAMALTLLDALASGAETLPTAQRCPALRTLLIGEPTLEEVGGQRRLVFRFAEGFNNALLDAGITRSVMMASLAYTMTTFLPGIEGIEVRIGTDRINTLTPSGIYGSGEPLTIAFPDGLMRRRDFPAFLLSYCALYFANGQGGLTRVLRPVPYYESHSARFLIQQLMLGPQPFDSQTGLSPALPQGLRDADILGVAYENGALLTNFSSQLAALSADLSPDAERRLVYSLVNTLCELRPVRRAAFFINGQQPETLSGALFLPGDFLPNADLVGE